VFDVSTPGTVDSATTAGAITGTTVHKYELNGGAALNTDVTMDNLMYSTAAELYKRLPYRSGSAVQRVDVYSSVVTKAKYDAKRQEFAAQGVSIAETWVFHGTPTLANVHSIMTEGFKVCMSNSSRLSALLTLPLSSASS
jgi:hypothetical protein